MSQPESEVCTRPEPICIQSELKKMTVLERVQLLNKIRLEEEKEEQEKIKVLEQTEPAANNTSAILQELRNLRKQVQDIRSEVQYLHRNQQQNQQLQKQLQCNQMEEYDCENSCSILSLVSDWMPMWIFLAFVLFVLTGKPRVCSLTGGIGGGSIGGTCPISGMSDIFTKL